MPYTSNNPTRLTLNTLIICASVAISIAGLYFLYRIQTFLLMFLIALVLALALAPFVRSLKKYGFNHAIASAVSMIATLIVFGVIATAVATPLVTQGTKLAYNAPQIVDSITHNTHFQDLEKRYHLRDRVKKFADQAPEKLSGASSPVVGAVGSVLGAVSTGILILVLTFFLLLEGPTSWKRFVALLDPEDAARVDLTANKVAQAVSGFVTGNLLISVIAGLTSLLILLICGVPYAFALAALVALMDLIPLVGATIATVILGLVALTQGVVIAIIVVVLMQVYQLIENNVIQPVVYSRTVSLSPLLVLIASIIGANMAGVLGVLLAIPVAASLQIVIIELLSGSRLTVNPKPSRPASIGK